MFRYQSIKLKLRKTVKRAIAHYRGFRIGELPKVPFDFVPDAPDSRINLVVLGARKDGAFGGTETALRFFESIRRYYCRSRIISLQEDVSDHDARWPERKIETVHSRHPHTIAYLQNRNFPLQIEPKADHFIATHWLTAYFVIELRAAMSVLFGSPSNPFVYLIQDFEPGFYPWSSRHVLAASTYVHPNDTIAVFNTNFLKEYFERTNRSFPYTYLFEPKLNPELALYKRRLTTTSKRRLMLVYGRPSSFRNAFELVVEALLVFTERYPNARDWEILSLGESHGPVRLSGGTFIKSGGKVSLDLYARYLAEASVGLSLMVSPHPSYPPLEMAEFGVRVVTNSFANKDLSSWSSNITSIDDVRPSSIADSLIEACETHEKNLPLSYEAVFRGTDDEFACTGDIAAWLKRSQK